MTKGLRWLVGGLVSGVFLVGALPFGILGALTSLAANVTDDFVSVGTVTGVVEEVFDDGDGSSVVPDASETAPAARDQDSSAPAVGYRVRVRYTPVDEDGDPRPERTGLAVWAGDSVPVVGAEVPVHYFLSSPSLPMEAGSATYQGIAAESTRKVSWVFLGISGGLLGIGLLGLVLTAVIAARAPSSSAMKTVPGSPTSAQFSGDRPSSP